MRFKRKRVSSDDEKKIISLMIIDDDFLKDTVQIARPEYFKLPYTQTLYRWLKDYYNEYNAAPKQQILDLFKQYEHSLLQDEALLIKEFLQEIEVDDSFNRSFYVDKAVIYFRKRALENLSEQIQSFTALDDLDNAEMLLSNFKNVVKLTNSWDNILDEEFVHKSMNVERERIFKMPGALGDLLGWWERGWLVAIQAGYGHGKSMFLQEIRLQALFSRLNVAEVNLEMSSERLARRFYKRITKSMSQESKVLYPVFDCIHNQYGTCKNPNRVSNISLIQDDKLPEYGEHPRGYKPCTVCRKDSSKRSKYKAATWFTSVVRQALDENKVIKKLKGFSRYAGLHRIKAYPKFSATISDIERDLDILEYSEGFVPDMIIVDYADILAPERDSNNDEVRINETWMKLAALAFKRKCIVVTATQINKEALKRQRGQMGDASGSARAKYAHPDVVFAISQKPSEKKMNIARVNKVKDRDGDCDPNKEVIILQDLTISTPVLDSEWSETPSEFVLENDTDY